LTYDPAILEAKSEQCAKQGPLLSNALLEARSEAGKMAILWATGDPINGEGVVVLGTGYYDRQRKLNDVVGCI
jgi:hypothetical protein